MKNFLFFPLDKHLGVCPVNRAYDLISDHIDIEQSDNINLVSTYKPSLEDLIPNNGEAHSILRMIVFGHSDEHLDGIMLNETLDEELIDFKWFSGLNFDVLILQVCFGANFMKNKNWEGVATKWISYDGYLDIILDHELSDRRWMSLYAEIVSAINECETLKEIGNRVRDCYINNIKEMEESDEEVDIINLIHFTKALQSMVVNER